MVISGVGHTDSKYYDVATLIHFSCRKKFFKPKTSNPLQLVGGGMMYPMEEVK